MPRKISKFEKTTALKSYSLLGIFLLVLGILTYGVLLTEVLGKKVFSFAIIKTPQTTVESHTNETLVEYTGTVAHIFFHSLIIYPEKAAADVESATGYRTYMITQEEFKKILPQLYDHGFILIDPHVLFSLDPQGNIHPEKLFLPQGKIPLILSVDDVNYYSYMKEGGFAKRLVLENGKVKTEVVTPEGNTIVTSDGDVIPILDSFIEEHPDFSFHGAKGVLGVTGFEGILGYRTYRNGGVGDIEKQKATEVAAALKKTGWVFASHSFSHNQIFRENTITKTELENDVSLWKERVEPLVGPTDLFIGPFGQVFQEKDPRRDVLLNGGFKVLFGIGMDEYNKFFDNHLVMNRINIDGYRLQHNATALQNLLGISIEGASSF